MGRAAIKHTVQDWVKAVNCHFWHPDTLTLSPDSQSARLSKITLQTTIWHRMLTATVGVSFYLAFIDISIWRSFMSNKHPVCETWVACSLIKLSALYNSQMLKFRLLDWHCAQLIKLMPVKSCQFAHLSFQVSLYIRAIIALFQHDLLY